MNYDAQNHELKIEFRILYDEKFVLLSDSKLIKDSLFHTFSVIVAKWDNFMWFNYNPT